MPWELGEHLPRCVVMLAVEFSKQSNKSHKEPQEADGQGSMAIGTFGSSLFGMKKELAKNACRPATQNVAGHKEFIRGMGQE